MNIVLDICDLFKSFGQKKVLLGLNFQLKSGEIVGFLGRNGQGKTTTLKLIMRFIRADKGNIQLFGESKPDWERIGFLHESPVFWGEFTPFQFLTHLSEISRRKKGISLEECLDIVGLEKERGLISTFSRGMKQRLGIAQALLNDPDFLILDEPMTALDPHGRIQIKDILRTLRQKNKTILFSSHQLLEVQDIADRVLILENGKLIEDRSIPETGNLEQFFLTRTGES